MRPYSKTLKFQNRSGKLAALISLGMGVPMMFFATSFIMPVIPQLVGICLLATAIYIASAYLLRELTFSFEIRDSEADSARDGFDFLIKERRAGGEFKHCHISLSDITLVRKVTKENKKQVKEERKNMRRFTFDTCFAPRERIEIVALVDDEDISMLISYDDEIFALLKEAV